MENSVRGWSGLSPEDLRTRQGSASDPECSRQGLVPPLAFKSSSASGTPLGGLTALGAEPTAPHPRTQTPTQTMGPDRVWGTASTSPGPASPDPGTQGPVGRHAPPPSPWGQRELSCPHGQRKRQGCSSRSPSPASPPSSGKGGPVVEGVSLEALSQLSTAGGGAAFLQLGWMGRS